ncbi:unnamed protein product, partial [Amoebophrya sp. A25]|eukprot:GSA25T00006023001.1
MAITAGGEEMMHGWPDVPLDGSFGLDDRSPSPIFANGRNGGHHGRLATSSTARGRGTGGGPTLHPAAASKGGTMGTDVFDQHVDKNMTASSGSHPMRASVAIPGSFPRFGTGESLEVTQLRQYLMERDAVIGQLENLLQDQSSRFRQSMQQVQSELFNATRSEKEMQVLLRSRQSQDQEEKNRLSMEKQRLEQELSYAAKQQSKEEQKWRLRAEELEKDLADKKIDAQRLDFLERD